MVHLPPSIPLLLLLLALVGGLPAQRAAEIVMLLDGPRQLDGKDLQIAANAAYGVEFGIGEHKKDTPHLTIGDGRASLRWAVFAVDILAESSPRRLTAEALVGLDDDEQKAVRGHRAQLSVRIEAVGPDAEARQSAYQVLGRIAAELLAGDVVALGCTDHGTFVCPGDGTVEALREEGALAALEATVDRSVVALLKAPRRWVQADLHAAVERAFGVKLSPGAGPDDQDFVVAKGATVVVKIGPRVVILTMRRETMDIDTSRMELRTKKAVDEHRAVLHLLTFGPPGAAEDRACHAHLGKLLGALWGDDCLALNWRADRAIVCDADDLPERLRAADPVAATLRGLAPEVSAQFDADAMAKAVATAREKFPAAERWFRGGGELFVKFPFPTRKGSGAEEHIWVAVAAIADGKVRGKLGNDPVDVEGLQLGSLVERPVEELTDWMYVEKGQRRGGFSIAVLQAGAAAEPVVLTTIDDVFAAIPQLASARAAAVTKADGRVVRFATLGPLAAELRARQAAALAAAVLLQTERIERGRAAPAGYAAERALQLRQVAALADGRYWIVEMPVAEWVALVHPQLADPQSLDWQQYELPPVAGKARTLVFPLDLRPAAVQAAAAGELAAFALVLDALPRNDRAALLGEAVATTALPLEVGEAGLATRIGTLPKGCRITADLRLLLPR